MRTASGPARALLRAVLLAASARVCAGQNAAADCGRLAQRGACEHAAVLDLCPDACAAAASSSPPAPPAWCAQLASGGELACGGVSADLCSEACAGAPVVNTQTGYRWSCPVLLRLDAGCAHDLSLDDPSVGANTRVSDVCPTECSGRGGCASTELDASFLGVMGDGSGHGHAVTLSGDACADDVGLSLGRGSPRARPGARKPPSEACPCHEKMPSTLLHVITVPRPSISID
eukprot:COSAG04_NODE_5745_length_1504_cov_1.881139_1_plen_231_part_01